LNLKITFLNNSANSVELTNLKLTQTQTQIHKGKEVRRKLKGLILHVYQSKISCTKTIVKIKKKQKSYMNNIKVINLLKREILWKNMKKSKRNLGTQKLTRPKLLHYLPNHQTKKTPPLKNLNLILLFVKH